MSDLNGDALASTNESALPIPSMERASNGTFARGHSGNPLGRPKGLRSRATLLAESMMQDDTEAVFRKILDKAKKGNLAALKFCAERIVPRMTSRPVDFEMPRASSLRDILDAHTALIEAMTRDEVDPAQAKTMATVLDLKRKSLESADFEDRITAMEDHMRQALRFTGGRQR